MNGNTGEELFYAFALYCINGIGRKTLLNAWKTIGSLKALYEMPEKELAEFLTAGQQKLFNNNRGALENVERKMKKLQEENIEFSFYGEASFPNRLKEIPDPPFALFRKGELPEEDQVCVGIIGARLCSEYGRYCAGEYGKILGRAGVTVISGMARGIDGISQNAALNAGGKSVGVLGCGVDVCYPQENREIYSKLWEKGTLLSEYLPGTAPSPLLFPSRNRIISGLSHVLLVIEARNKSGTLITVDAALEQGREVYALPGRVTDSLSQGCNQLLSQGANIALSPQDLLAEIRENYSIKVQNQITEEMEQTQNCRDGLEQLSKLETQVYLTIEGEPMTITEIASKNQNISVGEISRILLKLYSASLIRQTKGSYFRFSTL